MCDYSDGSYPVPLISQKKKKKVKVEKYGFVLSQKKKCAFIIQK